MARRRNPRLPGAAKGFVVLDSGAVTKVAHADPVACSVVERLTARGWELCIPAVTLAEVMTGRTQHDARVERLLKQVGSIPACGVTLAKAAGILRTKAYRSKRFTPSGIDAIVAALAVSTQPSIVLTTDAADMQALLASSRLAAVIGV